MNIYKTSSGKILQRNNMVVEQRDIYAFELEVSGTSFPDRTGFRPFRVNSVGSTNSMYIDPNDGFGEREYIGNDIILGSAQPNISFVYFQDVPENLKNTITPSYTTKRKIKIRFKYPKNVRKFYILFLGVFGVMPFELGLYNFSDFSVSQPGMGDFRWDTFPSNFIGFKSNNLNLIHSFKTILPIIPSWLYQGRFVNIILDYAFNLSGSPTSTNMDKIHNIQDLQFLNFKSNSLTNTSFADNLKLIPTLRTLIIQGNDNITLIPTEINNCNQITSFTINSSNLSTWGSGIGGMTSLQSFSQNSSAVYNQGLTTDLPTGMVNCTNLKSFNCSGSYRTQVRSDTWVNNMYDFIVANASTSTGNTKFRQMTILHGEDVGSGFLNVRPSGTYQDSTTPSTPMEKIYKMVKVYGHTWTVRNAANTGSEILAP